MYKIFIIIFFIFLSCSEIIEKYKYRELASEQASKKNCDANVELLLYKGKHKKGIECLRKIKAIIQE